MAKASENDKRRMREYYRKNKQRIWRAKYKEQLARLHKIKLESGCAFCGYNKCPAALEFHHLRDKKFTLGSSCTMRSWKSIEKEMAKCIVLCANCHAEVHFEAFRSD